MLLFWNIIGETTNTKPGDNMEEEAYDELKDETDIMMSFVTRNKWKL